MKSNLIFVDTESGATASALVIDQALYKKVQPFLAWDMKEFQHDPSRCVMPEYNHRQTQPLVRRSVTVGYDTAFHALLALLTGYHFFRSWPFLYRANSEGLRLIAEFGSPSKAYAFLMS